MPKTNPKPCFVHIKAGFGHPKTAYRHKTNNLLFLHPITKVLFLACLDNFCRRRSDPLKARLNVENMECGGMLKMLSLFSVDVILPNHMILNCVKDLIDFA